MRPAWMPARVETARAVRTDEVGEGALEAAIFGVVLVSFMLFAVLAGRLGTVKGDVESAARDAARAASLTGSKGAAIEQAQAKAEASLEGRSTTCAGGPRVMVDTAAFGAGGSVTVTVSCAVDLGDLTLLPVPGGRTVAATAVEVVDTYRGGR